MSGTGGVHNYDDMLPGSATGRDESAFYQAETQNLTRENQMLKLRIRELGEYTALKVWVLEGRVYADMSITERQLSGMNPTSPVTQAPAVHSGLNTATSQDEADTSQQGN